MISKLPSGKLAEQKTTMQIVEQEFEEQKKKNRGCEGYGSVLR